MTKKVVLMITLAVLIIVSIVGLLVTDLIAGSNSISSKQVIVTSLVAESPKIIAHRGANDRINEETISAYKIAAADGVDALEIDLRMTEDGALIAMHDQTINRTTNGKGEVSDFSWKKLNLSRLLENTAVKH